MRSPPIARKLQSEGRRVNVVVVASLLPHERAHTLHVRVDAEDEIVAAVGDVGDVKQEG